jgi:hypothetical protein
MKDRLSLLGTAAIVAMLSLTWFHALGEAGLDIIDLLMTFLLAADNSQLRRQLRERA